MVTVVPGSGARLDEFVFDVVVFLLVGLLLFLLLRALRSGLRFVPMTRARRADVARALPLFEAVVGTLYVLTAIALAFSDHPEYTPLVVGAIILGAAWLGRFAVRDVLDGVIIKAGQVCRVGDIVELDGLRGRIKRLGQRTLVVETAHGEEAVVPYSRVSRQSIVRTGEVQGASRHAFTVAPAAGVSAAEAGATIVRTAMQSHWASVALEPQVELREDGSLAVTVFALGPGRGPDIEASVRAALDRLTPALARARAASRVPTTPPRPAAPSPPRGTR